MKILVTGGAGFIGSHLVDRLILLGHQVTIIDNLENGSLNNINSKAEFVQANILDDAVDVIFEDFRPDVVYHFAAQISVQKSIERASFDAEINIVGTLKILEKCLKYKVKKIIYPSSAAIYGTPNYLPVDEIHPKNAESNYGLSKYIPEHYLKLFSAKFGIEYTVLRFSNVYGARQNHLGEGGVFSIFLDSFLNNKDCFIYGNGEQTRDFIYVKDVVSANILCLNGGRNATYNISSMSKTSINELYKMFCDNFNIYKKPIYKPEKDNEIRHSVLDNSKVRKDLGWYPEYTIEEGLHDILNLVKK